MPLRNIFIFFSVIEFYRVKDLAERMELSSERLTELQAIRRAITSKQKLLYRLTVELAHLKQRLLELENNRKITHGEPY